MGEVGVRGGHGERGGQRLLSKVLQRLPSSGRLKPSGLSLIVRPASNLDLLMKEAEEEEAARSAAEGGGWWCGGGVAEGGGVV